MRFIDFDEKVRKEMEEAVSYSTIGYVSCRVLGYSSKNYVSNILRKKAKTIPEFRYKRLKAFLKEEREKRGSHKSSHNVDYTNSPRETKVSSTGNGG